MYVCTYLVYADENVRKMLITFVIRPKCGSDSTPSRTQHVNKRWVDIYAIFQIASKLRKLFTRLIYALVVGYFLQKNGEHFIWLSWENEKYFLTLQVLIVTSVYVQYAHIKNVFVSEILCFLSLNIKCNPSLGPSKTIIDICFICLSITCLYIVHHQFIGCRSIRWH